MSDFGLVDNIGKRTVHPLAINPEAASGAILTTNAGADTNSTLTVESGRTLAITNMDGTSEILLGILTTATAANILWIIHPKETVLVAIPEGTTSLHHQSSGTNIVARVRKLALTSALT